MPSSLAVNPDARAALGVEQLSRAFTSEIQRPRTSPWYLAGLTAVAGAMLMILLLYIAVIAGAAYGVYYHAVYNTGIISEMGGPHGSTWGILIVYVGPLLAGLVLIFFLAKPLFAPRRRRPEPFTLDRASNPVLYAYVEALCRAMRAPVPRRIDIDEHVNASAGFRGGWWSMLTGRVVLTIGLPLAAGLNARELTGVLAHEFGHFTQRTAMRLGWLIGHINGSLGRLAYERDAWDEQLDLLARRGGHVFIVVLVWMCKLAIWLTRLLLKGLVLAAHAVSCFMSRQMEYDADAWQCRVVGSKSMATTYDQITRLGAASQIMFSGMQARWNEKRLPDDIPAFIAGIAATMEDQLKSAIRESEEKARRKWFSTHPTRNQRIAAAEKLGFEGVFDLEAPASALFADFPTVCRQVTYNHYTRMLGDGLFQATLIPTGQLLTQQGQVRQEMDDSRRFAIDDRLFPALRLRLPAEMPEPGDARQAVQSLKAVRERMRAMAPQAAVDAEAHATRWANELLGCRARAALAADIPLTREEISLGFQKGVDADALCQQLADLDERTRTKLDAFRECAAERVTCALRILQVEGADKKIPTARKDRRLAERMLPALFILNEARPAGVKLMRDLAAAERLFGRLRTDNKNQKVIKQLIRAAHRLHQSLFELRGTLSVMEYPFPNSAQGLTMGTYMVETLPSPDDVGDVLSQAQAVVDRFWPTYYRVLGPLLTATLLVEDALGMSALAVEAGPTVPVVAANR